MNYYMYICPIISFIDINSTCPNIKMCFFTLFFSKIILTKTLIWMSTQEQVKKQNTKCEAVFIPIFCLVAIVKILSCLKPALIHFWLKKCHMKSVKQKRARRCEVQTFPCIQYFFSVKDVVVILLVKHSLHQLILQHWWLLLWIRNSLDIEPRTKDLNFILRRKKRVNNDYVELIGIWIILKNSNQSTEFYFFWINQPNSTLSNNRIFFINCITEWSSAIQSTEC